MCYKTLKIMASSLILLGISLYTPTQASYSGYYEEFSQDQQPTFTPSYSYEDYLLQNDTKNGKTLREKQSQEMRENQQSTGELNKFVRNYNRTKVFQSRGLY